MGLKIKKGRFKTSRGGNSKILELFCPYCNEKILVYQKDGIGKLKRLYMDRILSPGNMTKLEKIPLDKIKKLSCSNCKKIIGNPYVYEKENRKAFNLHTPLIKKIKK